MSDLESAPYERNFDHTTSEWAQNAPEIWDDYRGSCPVARTDAFGGTWLPTRHEDVSAIAQDTDNFTSKGVIVSPYKPDIPPPVGYAPPITSDPPFHAIARRMLLPPFAPKPVNALEPYTRACCDSLADDLVANGPLVDAAVGYSQHIPVRIIAKMLGLPEEDGDKFRGFIHRIIESPGLDDDVEPEDTLDHYLDVQIASHRADPPAEGTEGDLIDYLIRADIEGMPLEDDHIRGTIGLLLIAGIDTTWSAIGATIWHLAQHPEHRRRLRDEPDLMPFAIEEFLRFYAPVTMARMVARDHEFQGCPMKEDDWLLLPFPAANRDPDAFERAGEVVLDRKQNRHGAFGLGIHRCLGSNLARMELRVAIETFLEKIPDFELADPESVRWSAGQIRGPRELPIRIL